MSESRLPDYLSHIVTAADRIAHYLHGMDAEEFTRNQLIQDAVIRNIEVIGEASRRVTVGFPEFMERYPELPFPAA